jgi:sugar lactone lactonase YvrE
MKRFNFHIFFISILFTCINLSCSKSGSNNPKPQNTKSTLSITSLSVTEGPYNTMVNIYGTGFSDPTASNRVFFNGKPAEIYTGHDNEITVYVPLGAGTGNVTITSNGITATGPGFTYQPTEVVTTFAGNLNTPGSVDGTGGAARFNQVAGLAIDKNGNLYVADSDNLLIRKVTPQGVVTTLAGSGKSGNKDGSATTASFELPTEIAVDQQGNVFVSDLGSIRKITPDGTVSTIVTHLNVGNVLFGSSLAVTGITVDAADNLYITDVANQFIGKVTPDGTVTAISGIQPLSGNGTITPTAFRNPNSIALDKSGNLFITDGTIWKVTLPNTVSQYAISGPNGGFTDPRGLAFDSSGNLYVADTDVGLIKKVATDGTITTFAGGNDVATGSNGPVGKASFLFPIGIVVDSSGNIFVADDTQIREITFE